MLMDLVLTVPVLTSVLARRRDPRILSIGAGATLRRGDRAAAPTRTFSCLTAPRIPIPTFNTQNLSPSPDAVKNFKWKTTATPPIWWRRRRPNQYRHSSGSSQYHGTIYEFLRNGAMDASTFASMANKSPGANNFGALVRGPFIGKKTFFFVNYKACA